MQYERQIQTLTMADTFFGNTTDVGLMIVEKDGRYGFENEIILRDTHGNMASHYREDIWEYTYDNIFELCTSHFIVIREGRFGLLRILSAGEEYPRELLVNQIVPCEYDYISIHASIMLHKDDRVRYYDQRTGFLSGYFDYLHALDDSQLEGYLNEKEYYIDLLTGVVMMEGSLEEHCEEKTQ